MNTENSVEVNAAEQKVWESEDTVSRKETCCEDSKAPGLKPMEMCPMAEMCKGMMEGAGRGSSWLLLLPGTLLVLGGLLVILVPEVLVWMLGLTSIALGVMLVFAGNGIRKFFAGLTEQDG